VPVGQVPARDVRIRAARRADAARRRCCSTAFLILWGPGLFRLNCYYYRRGTTARSGWPRRVRVRGPSSRATPGRGFPLIFQNSTATNGKSGDLPPTIFSRAADVGRAVAFRFTGRRHASLRGSGCGTLVMDGQRGAPGRLPRAPATTAASGRRTSTCSPGPRRGYTLWSFLTGQ